MTVNGIGLKQDMYTMTAATMEWAIYQNVRINQ